MRIGIPQGAFVFQVWQTMGKMPIAQALMLIGLSDLVMRSGIFRRNEFFLDKDIM